MKFATYKIKNRTTYSSYLKPNDVIEITATGLGILRNSIEDEKV